MPLQRPVRRRLGNRLARRAADAKLTGFSSDVRSPGDSGAALDDKRSERLKAALRDNLRRRKAAARPAEAPPEREKDASAGRNGSKRDDG
jgi:hypothetical protein